MQTPTLPETEESRVSQARITSAHAAQLVHAAQVAVKQGHRDQAYRFSVEATRLDPQNIDGWLIRARYGDSSDERMFALSRVHLLNPDHPAAKNESYLLRWEMLEKEPFLGYLSETDDLYYVRNYAYASLPVPKDRNIPEVYPPRHPSPLLPAYRLLWLAFLGLIFAGLGTLIFAPLAILKAARANQNILTRPDRVRVRVILLFSFLLLLPALFLAWIFVTHLRG